MTISELIELLQEIMEKEGDIDVAYVYNDDGYILNGEAWVCGVEVRLTPLWQGRRDLVRRTNEIQTERPRAAEEA